MDRVGVQVPQQEAKHNTLEVKFRVNDVQRRTNCAMNVLVAGGGLRVKLVYVNSWKFDLSDIGPSQDWEVNTYL